VPQIYLLDHWGTTPGLNFIYVHLDRLPRLQNQSAHVKDWLRNKLIEHKKYIVAHGEDMPEIRNWKWSY